MIPEQIKEIMKTFTENGYQVYLIGSFVRDSLITKIHGSEIQLVTNANKHQIITILADMSKDCNTTNNAPFVYVQSNEFRISIEPYNKKLKDSHVYLDSLEDHCAHIDFTINAIAMDIDMNTIDFVDGLHDVECGRIRTVLHPGDALRTDMLTSLKAIALSAYYNFSISRKLESYMCDTRYTCDLSNVRKKSISYYMNRIMCAKAKPSKYINKLRSAGVLFQIIPELKKCVGFNQYRTNHPDDVFNHILAVVDRVEPILNLRLAALFHDIAKPEVFQLDDHNIGHFEGHGEASGLIARKRLHILKYSQDRIDSVTALVSNHMNRYDYSHHKDLNKLIADIGESSLLNLFKLQIADAVSCKPPFNLDYIFKMQFKWEQLLETRNDPIELPTCYIRQDLIYGVYEVTQQKSNYTEGVATCQ